MVQVRATFDFDAQPGSGELTIRTGELLTVIRDRIDGGWIEGQNAKGKVGLFPESYVTKVSVPPPLPPTTAPPPLPPVAAQVPLVPSYSMPPASIPPPLPRAAPTFDPWENAGNDYVAPSYVPPSSNTMGSAPSGTGGISYPQLNADQSNYSANDNDDDFDGDWSDEDEEVQEFSAAGSTAGNQRNVIRSRSTGPETASMCKQQGGAAKMKTINRFSNFVKTGMESFILAAAKMNTPAGESHQIAIVDNQIEWQAPAELYTCVVSKPKKESKLKGLKSFIAYSITSSLTGIQVSRRYKHFDWLHEQLSNKYILISIPPLPEKQVAGRYEEDLIEHRKAILQIWVNKLCSHPVLSQSRVWKHFITCTDDGKSWKNGKRQAEKDEYVGGNFFNCITAPDQPLDSARMEKMIDAHLRSVTNLDHSIRELHERITDAQKRLIGPYKVNWQKLAGAFDSLGKSLDSDQSQPTPIKNAIKTSAHVIHKIGGHHEEHGKKDLEQILDYLYIYKGLCANIPDIVNVHKSALSKIKDNERLQVSGQLSPTDAEAIHRRVDVTTYAMMAEINHFNKERDEDFRQIFGSFFAQQAAFYSFIGNQMAHLSEMFYKQSS